MKVKKKDEIHFQINKLRLYHCWTGTWEIVNETPQADERGEQWKCRYVGKRKRLFNLFNNSWLLNK